VRRDMSGKLTYTVGVRAMGDVRIAGGGRKRDTSSSGQHGRVVKFLRQPSQMANKLRMNHLQK
jgi:hypothetical protein